MASKQQDMKVPLFDTMAIHSMAAAGFVLGDNHT